MSRRTRPGVGPSVAVGAGLPRPAVPPGAQAPSRAQANKVLARATTRLIDVLLARGQVRIKRAVHIGSSHASADATSRCQMTAIAVNAMLATNQAHRHIDAD